MSPTAQGARTRRSHEDERPPGIAGRVKRAYRGLVCRTEHSWVIAPDAEPADPSWCSECFPATCRYCDAPAEAVHRPSGRQLRIGGVHANGR
jgi:hypothetical protein